MSQLQRLYLSHLLSSKKAINDPDKLNDAIRSANIDLNPHQVDAAIFAFKSPLSRGAILADEVGLGKTIEAGLVINQLWVEGRRHILILVPASLRSQWQDELSEKVNLDSVVLDGQSLKQLQNDRQKTNPLTDNSEIYIASHNFASRYDIYIKEVNWDVVIIDEAHRLRNVWRKTNKTAKKIREAIKNRPKLLMTATPLQNNLMELFGLTSFIDENFLGTEFSYRTFFVNPVTRLKKFDNLVQLKERLMGSIDINTGEQNGGVLIRTLRKQVRGLVKFTNRFSITEDFAPNDDEIELYDSVSDYLRRPFLASTLATQRNMMELIYRKILASSSFAIAGTLEKIVRFLSKRLQKEQKLELEEIQEIVELIKAGKEKQYKKTLPDIVLEKVLPKEEIVTQETLPGFDDLEVTQEGQIEELQDSDDLGEDETFKDETKKVEEREIDHIFTKEEIVEELKDVLSYFYLASTIDVNQKSQALTRVLKKVFQYAEKKNWPQKSVIFTESRRTQDHLQKILEAAGYNVILFNGSNASQKASEIYNEWSSMFPEEAERASRSISIRKALVWKFKTIQKGILITTEAGAEGLNLQFSNIVINYDLPWNPQRVEQRIGRCHRYGQPLDVLVINFLNKHNYADQRVYELLSEKIKLFGNIFSFTDKVLGTEELTDDGYEVREIAMAGLGSGIDFERKILDIYRKCRTEKEIENSFQQLQLELCDVIEEKVEDAQKKVIQHFDEEVRTKLKIRQQQLTNSLNTYDNNLKKYLKLAFEGEVEFVSDLQFEYKNNKYVLGKIDQKLRDQGFRPVHTNLDFIQSKIEADLKNKGQWFVQLSHPIDRQRKYFEEYIGKSGQILVHSITCKRKSINGQDDYFEKLIITPMINSGDKWEKIEPSRGEKLLELDVTSEISDLERMRDELEDYSKENIKVSQDNIENENANYIEDEMGNMQRFVEESLLNFDKEIESRKREVTDLSRQLRASKTMGFYEREQIHEEIDKKQKELFVAQKKYIKAQEAQFVEKDKKMADLKGRLKLSFEVSQIARIKFTIIS